MYESSSFKLQENINLDEYQEAKKKKWCEWALGTENMKKSNREGKKRKYMCARVRKAINKAN